MKDLKGSKTEKNLMDAFAGESQARNKYTYYASQAKKDGYVQIQQIFEETARNEMEHAKLWFKYLLGGSIGSTEENLKDAAAGENFEWTEMYKRMAAEAYEEGFDEIGNPIASVTEILQKEDLSKMTDDLTAEEATQETTVFESETRSTLEETTVSDILE